MLFWDWILRYSSGLLSITELFSINPFRGLISIATPKER
jgi:hypothetical protein